MSLQTMRVGVLNTSKITGISVTELIGEIQEISGLQLPPNLPSAVNKLHEKYGKKAEWVVANTMFPFLITSDNPAPKKFKSLSKYDSTPEQIFVEVSSVNWTRDVETAAIGGFFDKNKKKKKKRKGMPMDMLKKARKLVKNVIRKMRKMKGSFKLTRKDIAVFAENEQLTAALKFAAKKRKVPSNRFKAFRNFVARKFAKLAKVIGEGRAMKALKATIALLKNAAKNPAPMQSKGFKAPKIGRYADESAGWRVNAPGQKLSYIMFKYVAAPLAALMGITMMWQLVPDITLSVLAGLGLIAFVVGLNKYSKRNKKKGKKFKQTV